MNIYDLFLVVFFLSCFILISFLLGSYIAKVFQGKYIIFNKLEYYISKFLKIDFNKEMDGSQYLWSFISFQFIGLISFLILLSAQHYLPLNPQGFPNIPFLKALNIAVSAVTNTGCQSYMPEKELSYLSQMAGWGVQNILSGASGFAVLLVFIRGITRTASYSIGNFWSDLTKTVLFLLLPLCFLFSLFIIQQGSIQTFRPYEEIITLEGAQQIIPLGPVATQVASKLIGSSGAGYFNANSAHPFENPTPLTNFIQLILMLAIPGAQVIAFGNLSGFKRHSQLIFVTMLFLWLISLSLTAYGMNTKNPILNVYPVLEGKEARFSLVSALLWTMGSSASSNGGINNAISSLTPLGSAAALFNMFMRETVFGSIGIGLCNMLIFILLTVFVSGQIVGRTPEYLGNKIRLRKMKWVMVSLLLPAGFILMGASLTSVFPSLLVINPRGPHGLTEILYTFTSTTLNNGTTMADINYQSNYFYLILSVAMFIGRWSIVVPGIKIAALLAKQKKIPFNKGTFSVDSLLFFILLIFIIIMSTLLIFFPALSLGPISEHFFMIHNKFF